jgi:hypothetical protein
MRARGAATGLAGHASAKQAQGAPTAPALANLCAVRPDLRVEALA